MKIKELLVLIFGKPSSSSPLIKELLNDKLNSINAYLGNIKISYPIDELDPSKLGEIFVTNLGLIVWPDLTLPPDVRFKAALSYLALYINRHTSIVDMEQLKYYVYPFTDKQLNTLKTTANPPTVIEVDDYRLTCNINSMYIYRAMSMTLSLTNINLNLRLLLAPHVEILYLITVKSINTSAAYGESKFANRRNVLNFIYNALSLGDKRFVDPLYNTSDYIRVHYSVVYALLFLDLLITQYENSRKPN